SSARDGFRPRRLCQNCARTIGHYRSRTGIAKETGEQGPEIVAYSAPIVLHLPEVSQLEQTGSDVPAFNRWDVRADSQSPGADRCTSTCPRLKRDGWNWSSRTSTFRRRSTAP